MTKATPMKRVYHFLEAKWAIDDIAKRRLRISRMSALNDPFEFLGFDISDKAVRRAYMKARDQMDSRTGLLCFCDNWKNPLMWAHYGDRYRGICLGFDVPLSDLTPITYVRHRAKAPDILAATDSERIAFTEQLTSTKYDHWSYEGEHRLYITLEEQDADGQFYFPFGHQMALRQVLVGAQSTTTRSEVAAALGSLRSTVATMKTRPGFGRFEVVENRDRSMWK